MHGETVKLRTQSDPSPVYHNFLEHRMIRSSWSSSGIL